MSEVLKNVIIISTAFEGVLTMETTATTWGELLVAINEQHQGIMNPTGNNPMKVTVMDVNSKQYSVVNDTDNIPEGDFRIMLTPSKNKSGNVEDLPGSPYIKEIRTKMISILDKLIVFLENVEADVEEENDLPTPVLEEEEEEEDDEIKALREAMNAIAQNDGVSL